MSWIRRSSKGELKRLSLPRRFHGNPLVIPKPVWLSDFNRCLEKNQLSTKLKTYIEKQRRTGYPLLIFASEIEKGERLKEILQRDFPNEKIGLFLLLQRTVCNKYKPFEIES